MIRRETPGAWLLISQVDHAHLAAQIAERWGNSHVAALPDAARLVPAIREHDAGWAEWERSPQIDPASGIPRSFLEMPMAVATAIWSRSIARAAADSPAGGLWVSRHFCWLAELAQKNRRSEPAEVAAVDEFLREQRVGQLFQADASRESVSNPQRVRQESLTYEEAGFRWLQFFDGLSLWLCCAPRDRPHSLPIPGGGELWLKPRGDTSAGRIQLVPYPLDRPQITLTVTTRRVAARPFVTDASFQAAYQAAEVQPLCWTFFA